MSLAVTLVYNPSSGSALSVNELKKRCEQHSISVEHTIKIGPGFEHKLKAPIKRGDKIMAVGGDGTISAVAGLLVNTRATLVPIPGGTLNNFTADAGIPQNIDDALSAMTTASARQLDIASVGNSYFINNSSIGLYPQSLRIREQLEGKFGKWPAALVATIRAFVRYRTYAVTIGKESFRTPFIFVGNNAYTIDGPSIARRQSLDEGILSVFVVENCTRWQFARLFVLAAHGRLSANDPFQHFTTTTLSITSRHHSTVSISHDGELSKVPMPITYTIHKHALRILG